MSEEARYAVPVEKLQKSVAYTSLQFERLHLAGEGLTKIVIKGPQDAHDEYFCVVTGVNGEGAPVVAFHTASTFSDALIGIGNRLRNGSFSWRLDEYAQNRR